MTSRVIQVVLRVRIPRSPVSERLGAMIDREYFAAEFEGVEDVGVVVAVDRSGDEVIFAVRSEEQLFQELLLSDCSIYHAFTIEELSPFLDDDAFGFDGDVPF